MVLADAGRSATANHLWAKLAETLNHATEYVHERRRKELLDSVGNVYRRTKLHAIGQVLRKTTLLIGAEARMKDRLLTKGSHKTRQKPRGSYLSLNW